MATAMKATSIALRGTKGTWIVEGAPPCSSLPTFPRVDSKNCRCMQFSNDGTLFASCNGTSVTIVDVTNGNTVCEIAKPRTASLQFSPCNNVLATWEPYMVTKDQAAGTPNLNLWKVKTGELVKGLMQKKHQGWCPQWSADEGICARNVNNEVHVYEKNDFGVIVNKLHLQKVADFSICAKSAAPYHVAAYVPGAKGQPSFVRVYRYPNFGGPGATLANKSFYKADKCDMVWNKRGNALLVLTATDTSADSYYGDQGLHYVGIDGESCLVPRNKNGPIYHVEWNPKSTDFCVVFGFMPAKASLFNLKCEPIFEFGTGPRNAVYYNPFGHMLVLAGFGNLQGNIEIWDLKSRKMITNPKSPDTTYFEWSADGQHILTATTAPRLRVGNGFKVWHYTGSLLFENKLPENEELWEAVWQPALDGVFKEADVQPGVTAPPVAQVQQQPQAAAKAYVPPHLRNNPQANSARGPRFREEYEKPSNMKQQESQEPLSKSALKNKKRKEAKKAKTAAEEAKQPQTTKPVQPAQTHLPAASDLSETEKKLRNLKKKVQQIEKLKQQQAAGKELEINQLEKIKSEASLLKEIKELSL